MQRLGIEIERVQVDLTAVIRTVEREQAGLQCDEGRCASRAYRAAHDLSCVGMQAARNVEGERGNAQIVDGLDPLRVRRADFTRETEAKNAIDYHPPALRSGQGGSGRAAGFSPGG